MKWRAAKIERADQTMRNQLLRKLQNNQQAALLDAHEDHSQLRSDMSALRQWR
jgi:hypothetical protein